MLLGAHITPLTTASTHVHADPTRTRKLLMHREEINRLVGKVERAGYTLAPLDLHYKSGRIKIEVGLAKGKKQHDKRDTIKEREWAREQQRLLRNRTGSVRAARRGVARREATEDPVTATSGTHFERGLPRNRANHVPLSPVGFLERARSSTPTASRSGTARLAYTYREFEARCRRLAARARRARHRPRRHGRRDGAQRAGDARGALRGARARRRAQPDQRPPRRARPIAFCLEHGEAQACC